MLAASTVARDGVVGMSGDIAAGLPVSRPSGVGASALWL